MAADPNLRSDRIMEPTVVRPSTARGLIVAFVLVILAVPLWDAFGPVETHSHEALGVAASAVAGEGPLSDLAAAMERFEETLEDTSDAGIRVRSSFGPLVRRAGGARGDVLIGREGWLFLQPGVNALLMGPRKTADDPLPAIAGFSRQLAERGIRLVLLPAPTKAAIHPRPLAPRFPELETPLEVAGWSQLRADLEKAGVEIYDPASDILRRFRETGEPAYLKDDTHWRPEVVDEVARRLAERIGPELSGASLAEWTRSEVQVTGVGDLRRTLEPEAPARQPLTLQVVREPEEARAENTPVLLLGDSFSNVFSDDRLGWGSGAGLAEQLAFHLQRPVRKLAIDGGGATEVRERLASRLAQGTMSLAGVEVVVWEVAAREFALAEWKPVSLSPAGDAFAQRRSETQPFE